MIVVSPDCAGGDVGTVVDVVAAAGAGGMALMGASDGREVDLVEIFEADGVGAAELEAEGTGADSCGLVTDSPLESAAGCVATVAESTLRCEELPRPNAYVVPAATNTNPLTETPTTTVFDQRTRNPLSDSSAVHR
jgi:hypothetical protein